MKNYSFSIYVSYPKNCKITINDNEISKISVPEGTLINWKIEKEGYKTEKGEIRIYSDFEYLLKLQLKQQKSLDPSTEFYTKISYNKENNKYEIEYSPIDESSIPSTENHNKEFLSNENGILVWKNIKEEFFSPSEKDKDKFLQWSGKDFVFSDPLPEPIDQSSDYILHHIGGNTEWISKELISINWGNIQGLITDQNDLCEILTDFQENINSVQSWTSSFSVDENSLSFNNNILSIKDDYIKPEVTEIKYSVSDLKRRHLLYEKATDLRFYQRATAPDYSQIKSMPELNNYNMFSITEHYWAIVESSKFGDELIVYDAIRSVDGKPLEPLPEKYLATIYRNTSNSGNDLKYVLLTKNFYYKLSNPETMHITLVGEMPYGETP